MSINVKSIRIQLKKYRKRANLTQLELANEIGISKSYVSEIEHGQRNPSLDILVKISIILNICIGMLIDYEIND